MQQSMLVALPIVPIEEQILIMHVRNEKNKRKYLQRQMQRKKVQKISKPQVIDLLFGINRPIETKPQKKKIKPSVPLSQRTTVQKSTAVLTYSEWQQRDLHEMISMEGVVKSRPVLVKSDPNEQISIFPINRPRIKCNWLPG